MCLIPFTLCWIVVEKTEPDFILKRLASSIFEIEIHFVLENIIYWALGNLRDLQNNQYTEGNCFTRKSLWMRASHGLGFVFYPDFGSFGFSRYFSTYVRHVTCSILFFILIQIAFYPDWGSKKNCWCHDWKWIKSRKFSLSVWNPVRKKRILHMIRKCPENQLFAIPDKKENPRPWLAFFHEPPNTRFFTYNSNLPHSIDYDQNS